MAGTEGRITVMLTSCGGLVMPGIIECLRAEKNYNFRIVGVDMNSRAIGAHFVDAFNIAPAGTAPDYPDKILELARKEDVDVVVPLSDEEVLGLCRHRKRFSEEGISVLCSDPAAVEISSDKGKMLTFLKERGVPVPEFYLPASLDEMDEAVESLGYPEKEVVLKPTTGRGARGFWILSEKKNGQDLILRERSLQRLPYSVVRSLLSERPELPPVVTMQYLRGNDYNVDVLAMKGKALYSIPMQRIVPEAGPVQVGQIIHDARIDEMVKQITAVFGFNYNINIEFAYPDEDVEGIPMVYEINPRMSAPIAAYRAAGINLMLFGILLCMGRSIPQSIGYKNTLMQRCWMEVYS